jgi:hypothetical protein
VFTTFVSKREPVNVASLPFLSGIYTTGPGLVPLSKNGLPDNRIFDIDDEYEHYLANKTECRQDLSKHYCIKDFAYAVELSACLRMARELARSYPNEFSFYESEDYVLRNRLTGTSVVWNSSRFAGPSRFVSLFDAIANQVQEDLAVFQIETSSDGNQRDWLAAIHLCSPNHWDPRDKAGRPFPEIHRPVPAMERTVSQYKPMLQTVITKGPFARYAWGVDKDNKLNHHPDGPNQKKATGDNYYIRMERQHLVGLPEVNAFLFTIRTYFFDVDQLGNEEKKALASAVRSMTAASLDYKRMTPFVTPLLNKLDA